MPPVHLPTAANAPGETNPSPTASLVVGSGLDRSAQLCGRIQRPGGVKTLPYKISRKLSDAVTEWLVGEAFMPPVHLPTAATPRER